MKKAYATLNTPKKKDVENLMKRAPIPLPPGKDYRYVHDKIMSDIKTLRRKEKKKRDAEKPKKHPPKRNAVASQSKVADEVAFEDDEDDEEEG